MPLEWPGEFQITSAPVIGRGVVIVGSSIADNRRVEAPPGTVRAFDARTGRPRWTFDPLMHDGVDRRPRQCLGADVGGRGARPGVPADVLAEPGFLGRQAARQQRHANSVVALRAETGELVWSYPDRASRCLGLRSAGAADAGAHRHRRGPARRRDPADQAGICVRARPRHRQAGMAGRGTRRAARRRRRRAALADAAVSDPCAGADVAADFGRRCVRPDSVLGARCLPRAGRGGAQRGPLHAAVDAGHGGVSDDRRRRELGRRRLRSGQPDPLRQHFARDPHRQADSARRRGRRVQSAARSRFRTAAGRAVCDDARGRDVAAWACCATSRPGARWSRSI